MFMNEAADYVTADHDRACTPAYLCSDCITEITTAPADDQAAVAERVTAEAAERAEAAKFTTAELDRTAAEIDEHNLSARARAAREAEAAELAEAEAYEAAMAEAEAHRLTRVERLDKTGVVDVVRLWQALDRDNTWTAPAAEHVSDVLPGGPLTERFTIRGEGTTTTRVDNHRLTENLLAAMVDQAAGLAEVSMWLTVEFNRGTTTFTLAIEYDHHRLTYHGTGTEIAIADR